MPHVRIWPGGDGQPSSLPGPNNVMNYRKNHWCAWTGTGNRDFGGTEKLGRRLSAKAR